MIDTSKEAIERVRHAVEDYSGQVPRGRAADMIEALAAERDKATNRIEALEAKLAKAVEALEYYNVHGYEGKEARITIKEMKGNTDAPE